MEHVPDVLALVPWADMLCHSSSAGELVHTHTLRTHTYTHSATAAQQVSLCTHTQACVHTHYTHTVQTLRTHTLTVPQQLCR